MNNPPVENEARTTAGSSETGGHPSATDKGLPAHPAATDQEALVGPFGLRDTVVGGSVLVMLVGSILPFFTVTRLGFEEDFNLWNAFSLFFIGIGILLPLLVAGLFAGRRLAPTMKPRVGSLSLDQFASVAAVLALAFFFIQTVTDFSVGAMVALVGSLGLVVSTTLAPHLPFFAREFRNRPEAAAALTARDALPLRPRPARPKPEAKPETENAAGARRFTNPLRRNEDARTTVHDAPSQSGTDVSAPGGTAVVGTPTAGAAAAAPATSAHAASTPSTQVSPATASPATQAQPAAAPAAGMQAEEPMAATTVNPVVRDAGTPEASAAGAHEAEAGNAEPITATRDESEAVVEAFWFAVGTPRQIVDERTGLPLFMFHPGDWELGLEDRGDEFLVQDKRTGRIGVLRDLSNIERVDADQ
ncbi:MULTISPECIES: hypothetical protein [unclassified Arthrobacter]|uniref:hypothetical protein n=1 Tax=unclassified Arthrobacter TaxID=235627 RepID=UPI001D15B208|nr:MULTISPECIES: hypothetical protein [unclassified Arthrobacter]MCC3290058.1 hypothetical protein [Arthrobacter sp. zg-Y1110]MCC3300430.1 hypothetical protein [Arthrobacter sp. zg-Y895]UWX84544.1 hypothetical protein N2K99_13885 [Arthrobacter sp. zg-Y1110]